MSNFYLTRNFSLDEFTRSQTADQYGIEVNPSHQVVSNLTRLCVLILQPLRDEIDLPIIITSGYRPTEVNRIIGGSDNSQHLHGLAADIIVPGLPTEDVCDLIALMEGYDQVIAEFGHWTHVSVPELPNKPRNEYLVATRKDKKVVYRRV